MLSNTQSPYVVRVVDPAGVASTAFAGPFNDPDATAAAEQIENATRFEAYVELLYATADLAVQVMRDEVADAHGTKRS